MAHVDWRIIGPELSTCNCNWGCPCQFNSLPSHGDCKAVMAMRIDRGHFGEVELDGLVWAGVYCWPGAIHDGHGEALTVIDERADERQRAALLTILAGKETDPGATVFSVFAATFSKVHRPLFKPIEFEVDVAKCTGRFAVDGLFESRAGPIRNPITGEPHRARLKLPHGFEFITAEFASSTTKARQPKALDWTDRHAHFAMLDLGPRGPIRH